MTSLRGAIIDVDVHHRPSNDLEIAAYLAPQWQRFVHGNDHATVSIYPPSASTPIAPYNSNRADTAPTDGGPPGSSYQMLRDQLLDRYDYYRCIVLHDVGQFATHLNPYYAVALCSAVNDWNIDTWLTFDSRIYSVVVAPLGSPVDAAIEIRRVGGHDRMCGVLLSGNPLGKPIGDPVFHPFWKAAAEMDLPVILHPSTTDRPGSQMGSVGAPKARIEGTSQLSQQAMHYISSLIVHGVFEQFPNLRLVIAEYGLGWLPYLTFRLDQHYRQLQHESPWVKNWPSEYIRKHVRLSTQPIEEGVERKTAIADLLATVDGVEDLLCFASDYPHYSMDDPMYVSRLLPEAWHRKVFFENACALHGWPAPSAAGALTR